MNQGQTDYPPDPYGHMQGSIIENMTFVGKADPDGAMGDASYATVRMQAIGLEDYYKDPLVKLLVLLGVAGWSEPCRMEQYFVKTAQVKYEPQGVRFFEAMIEGYDEMTGSPATEADVNKWQQEHRLHIGIGLDPEDKIRNYGDVAAFPLNMIVRTSDMKIVYMGIGEEDIGLPIAVHLQQK